MVIAIREGSDIPIYQQIRDQIVLGISEGKLEPGEQLPTVRALAEEIGINSMTVNKANQLLKQQGYIIADRRNGVRVSKTFGNNPQLSLESRELLRRIIAEAKLSGMTQEEFLEECRNCYQNDSSDSKIRKGCTDCPKKAQANYLSAASGESAAKRNIASKSENTKVPKDQSFCDIDDDAENKSGAGCENDLKAPANNSCRKCINGKEDYVYA